MLLNNYFLFLFFLFAFFSRLFLFFWSFFLLSITTAFRIIMTVNNNTNNNYIKRLAATAPRSLIARWTHPQVTRVHKGGFVTHDQNFPTAVEKLPQHSVDTCAGSFKMASACGDGYAHWCARYSVMMMMMSAGERQQIKYWRERVEECASFTCAVKRSEEVTTNWWLDDTGTDTHRNEIYQLSRMLYNHWNRI